MRRIIALLGDMHSGSRLGLLNPATRLLDDDGAEYAPTMTATQSWLWDCYEDALIQTMTLADGDPVTLIHNGDVCQGDRHGPLVSPLVADQAAIAVANLVPWLALGTVTGMVLVTGTEAHDYSGGSAEQIVAQAMSEYLDVRYMTHGLLDVDGVLLDVAHHGPHPGARVWLKGNIARFYLRDRIIGEIGRGNPVPALYVRAHRHEPVDETLSMYGHHSRLIVTPSWQGAGQYVRNVAQSLPHICCGMAAAEIVDGRLVAVHWYRYELDLRRRERL